MAGDVGGDVVVAAAHALQEGVTGSEDPYRPVGHCQGMITRIPAAHMVIARSSKAFRSLC